MVSGLYLGRTVRAKIFGLAFAKIQTRFGRDEIRG